MARTSRVTFPLKMLKKWPLPNRRQCISGKKTFREHQRSETDQIPIIVLTANVIINDITIFSIRACRNLKKYAQKRY